MQKTRRSFLKTAGTGLIVAPSAISMVGCNTTKNSASTRMESNIPDKSNVLLNVKDYGAKGDGVTKETGILQQVIDRCSVLGGGEVLFPAGNYFTGALALRSNVLLRLDKE